MFKRIAVVVTAVLAIIGLAAVPAQAAWSCPTERVCFYWDANGVGSESLGTQYNFNVTIGGASYVEILVGEPVRSHASSLKNNKSNTYISRLYGGPNCFSLYGWQDPNLHHGGVWNIGGTVNDHLTCFRIGWV